MKILIVDDSPTNRKLLRAQLEAEGYDVIEAGDGVEALEILGQCPEAVISDILMPKMDGFCLCSEIRKNDTYRTVPFIVYSATHVAPSDRERCMRLGANVFIKKPAPIELITTAITRVTTENKHRNPRAVQSVGELPAARNHSEPPMTKYAKKDDDFMERLLPTFNIEAGNCIHALATHLIELEKTPSVEKQTEIVEDAFREAHSLKGAACLIKAVDIEAICRSMEGMFSAISKNKLGITPSSLIQLHRAVDALQSLASSLATDQKGAGHPEVAGIIRILEGLQKGKQP